MPTDLPLDGDLAPALIRIDLAAHQAWQGDRELRLTPTEFRLLACLTSHAGQVLTYEEIRQEVWKTCLLSDGVVRQNVMRLRGALGDRQAHRYIAAAHGIGYRFEAAMLAPPPPPPLSLPVDVFELARMVAEEFVRHEGHARDRACQDVAAHLREQAAKVRADETAADPLVEALMARCHIQAGAIHAWPRVVAAVAYEAMAVLLTYGDPTRAPHDPGQHRTLPDVPTPTPEGHRP